MNINFLSLSGMCWKFIFNIPLFTYRYTKKEYFRKHFSYVHVNAMLLQTGPASLNGSNSSSSSTISSSTNTATATAISNSSLPLHHHQHPPAPSSITSSSSASSTTPPTRDVNVFLESLQDQLKDGFTVHTAKDGRLYYCK